jgi:hypothetical protein
MKQLVWDSDIEVSGLCRSQMWKRLQSFYALKPFPCFPVNRCPPDANDDPATLPD